MTCFCYKEKGQEKKCLKCLERRKAIKCQIYPFQTISYHIRENSQNKNPGYLTFVAYITKMIASE